LPDLPLKTCVFFPKLPKEISGPSIAIALPDNETSSSATLVIDNFAVCLDAAAFKRIFSPRSYSSRTEHHVSKLSNVTNILFSQMRYPHTLGGIELVSRLKT
jgi:hypothetical protein